MSATGGVAHSRSVADLDMRELLRGKETSNASCSTAEDLTLKAGNRDNGGAPLLVGRLVMWR